jgi:hypothetical protein
MPIDWSELVSRADFIGSAVGALLGFLLAIVVLFVERLVAKRQEWANKRAQFENILGLLTLITKGARQLQRNYELLSEQYRTAPYTIHDRPIHVNVPLRTLDRVDRLLMLEAITRMKGRAHAWELWRELLGFIDTYSVQVVHQEKAVLTSMEELAALGMQYDVLCREVHLLATNMADRIQSENPADPALPFLGEIVVQVASLGDVPPPKLQKQLIDPIADLYLKHRLTIQDSFPLIQAHSQARAAYRRIASTSADLSLMAKGFSQAFNELAGKGEILVSKFRGLK